MFLPYLLMWTHSVTRTLQKQGFCWWWCLNFLCSWTPFLCRKNFQSLLWEKQFSQDDGRQAISTFCGKKKGKRLCPTDTFEDDMVVWMRCPTWSLVFEHLVLGGVGGCYGTFRRYSLDRGSRSLGAGLEIASLTSWSLSLLPVYSRCGLSASCSGLWPGALPPCHYGISLQNKLGHGV